jgi:hypothetical protein
MGVIELSEHRQPVCYTVHLRHHWNGALEIFVEDVADDVRSRIAVADALILASEMLRMPNAAT